jgi:hypothetical protein
VPGPGGNRITRDDVTSMIGARQELGEDMEPAVVDAFLDRVEAQIEARAAERRPPVSLDPGPGTGERLALAIVSLGTGIPITAIAATAADALGIAVAWTGIAAVNFAFSRKRD